MRYTSLFKQAQAMLRETNPWASKKRISSICYTSEGEFFSLIDILNRRLSSDRFGTLEDSAEQICYDGIALSMVEYLENYHPTFSYKQQTKIKFANWLKKIQEDYHIKNRDIPSEFNVQNEMDTGITLIKALHANEGEGRTKGDLCSVLGNMDARSVQTNLRKIDPSLSEGEEPSDRNTPFRVGGQPLLAKIEVIQGKYGKKFFRTPNTVHPIVLQENLLEVEILLRSLCLSYYQKNSNISLAIAVDIWSQLSDYAKGKIDKDFKCEDKELHDFIQLLKDDFPDDHVCSYQTQHETIEHCDPTIADKLCDALKLSPRKYSLKYKKPDKTVIYLQQVYIRKCQHYYYAIDENGEKHYFEADWVYTIERE